jgi:hypothetical protein
MAGNPTLVLAFFESEETADGAAGALLGWAKGNRMVQLDAVGVLVKDAQGDLKRHKLGPREGTKGIGVGAGHAAVGALVPANQAPAVSEELEALGGEPELHEVSPGDVGTTTATVAP